MSRERKDRSVAFALIGHQASQPEEDRDVIGQHFRHSLSLNDRGASDLTLELDFEDLIEFVRVVYDDKKGLDALGVHREPPPVKYPA